MMHETTMECHECRYVLKNRIGKFSNYLVIVLLVSDF